MKNIYAESKELVDDNNNTSTNATSNITVTPGMMQMYYSHLFPYTFLYSWLSYGNNNKVFANREFSFTIEPTAGEEIYLRYQSFANEEEMKQSIMKRSPKKIDIGAIYSQPPKDKSIVQSSKLTPDGRELIFDIDMDDYDEVRNCGCSGPQICPICWNFMKMAVKVMDRGLREDFGFQHIAWFYSGRRGMHGWVCDEHAITLTDEARGAITKYFQVQLGTANNKDAVDLPNPMHPMLQESFDILEPMFINNIIPASGHGLLATEENWMGLLNSLPDAADAVRTNLGSQWAKSHSSPLEKWDELKKHLDAFIRQSSKAGSSKKASKNITTKERNRLETWIYEIVFRYTYPRLDVNVSKARNHLLKSPFCVHPKSGRVCVPVKVETMDTFDPFAVPTVSQVLNELDEYEKHHATMDNDENDEPMDSGASKRMKGNASTNWQKTSLKQYYEPFQNDFLDPLLRKMRRNQRDAKDQHAAMLGDF